ncbi:MAG: helix-turn-helix domain-containing protein [Acidobacteriota bacterium]
MELTIEEVARALNVNESVVRSYIASGKLRAEHKRLQVFVSEEDLQAFLETRASRQGDATEYPTVTMPVEALTPLIDRIAALDARLEEQWNLIEENRRLAGEIRARDRALAQKDAEIESLKRDLAYQKVLAEKELEEQRRVFQEKWELMERETADKLAILQRSFEEKFEAERGQWEGKLAVEQENFAQRIAEARRREGLWSKLIKMMTWSE